MGTWLPLPFGAELRRLRHAARLTQAQLGEAVGREAVTIRSYENGLRNAPDPDDLAPFCTALQLAETDCDLLKSAAKRTRAVWADPRDINQDAGPKPVDVPQGVTPEAHEAVTRFGLWYRPQLAKAMATQLSVVVWCPAVEMDGPIAAKRADIRARLRRLGHLVVDFAPNAPQESEHGVSAEEPDHLSHADLIVILAEDDPLVVDQVTHFCQRADVIPKVKALLPERFEPLIEADLDILISGYTDVFWYDAADVEASNLVKQAVRCSEARRKVKAFMGAR